MNEKFKYLNNKIKILENKLKDKKKSKYIKKNEDKYNLIKNSILSGNNNGHLINQMKNIKQRINF